MAYPPATAARRDRTRQAVTRRSTRLLRGALSILMASLPTGGCTSVSILRPAGPIAAANRTILLDALAIMLTIVVPTIIATFAFAWWFRAGNPRAQYRPEFAYSGRVELIVWSIPLLVVLFLSGVIWIGSHDLDPARPIGNRVAPLEIQVVSLDWKWLFIYPAQGVATVNEVVVPAGVQIRFRLTSASVMNAFFVPRLGSMIYTMNGMATTLHLQADGPGTFYDRSAHFSGDGFSKMSFRVRALPQAAYAQWVAGLRGKPPSLDASAYAALAQPGPGRSPFAYGNVQLGLFQAVLDQRVPPAPGARAGNRDAQVSPESTS